MIFIKGEGEKKRITTEISGSPTEIMAELTMAIRGAMEILKQGLPMYDCDSLVRECIKMGMAPEEEFHNLIEKESLSE